MIINGTILEGSLSTRYLGCSKNNSIKQMDILLILVTKISSILHCFVFIKLLVHIALHIFLYTFCGLDMVHFRETERSKWTFDTGEEENSW